MLIILNPNAGGERAIERWEDFCATRGKRLVDAADIVLGTGPGIDVAVTEALTRGERRFVAAGGDGTVNALVNSLMKLRRHPGFGDVALGAIGLGSSNDFHKSREGGRPAVPSRIDFDRVRRQDVGCVDLGGPGGTVRRHFIVNASVGVTAEGNEAFNRSRGVVSALKRVAPGLAIAAAALQAIARHSNLDVEVTIDGEPARPVSVSNIAILKNPSISGPMRGPADVSPDDGMLGLWMEEGLSRASLFRLFIRLMSGRFVQGEGTTVRRCASLRVRAGAPFAVEYDGEVSRTDDATFSILRSAIGVCQ